MAETPAVEAQTSQPVEEAIQPVEDVKEETPVVSEPVVEPTPVVEAPVETAPVEETPMVETPVVETPVAPKPVTVATAAVSHSTAPMTRAPAPDYVPEAPRHSDWVRPSFDFEGKGSAGGHSATHTATAGPTRPQSAE